MAKVDTGSVLSMLTLIERDARNARELFVLASVQRGQAQQHQIVAGRFANGGLVASGPNPSQLMQAAANLDAQASQAVRNTIANAGALQAMIEGGEEPEAEGSGLVTE